MFVITALQIQAYRVITDAAHRRRHLDVAASTMVAYLDEMQRADGLIPHHLDREDYAIDLESRQRLVCRGHGGVDS